MEGEPPTQPSHAAEGTDREAGPSVSAFEEALLRRAPGPMEARLQRELAHESEPVLDAFARALDGMGVREALALAGLLARRTAELGASAIELAAVIEALLDALAARETALAPADVGALRGIMIDGFSRAEVERERERETRARVACSRPFVVAPRCLALVLQGSPDADWIGGAVEALGPALLGADARSVLVLATFDQPPSDGAVAQLAACVDLADVVGARVVYSVPKDTAPLLTARLGPRAEVLEDEPARALADALSPPDGGPVRARVAGLLRRLGV